MINPKTMAAFLLASLLFILSGCKNNKQTKIETPFYTISWSSSSVDSWKYTFHPEGKSVEIELPVFEIDGEKTPVSLSELAEAGQPSTLSNGAIEHIYESVFQTDTTLRLQVKFRIAADSPVIRFCYSLKSSGGQKLTKKSGIDNLDYLSCSLKDFPETKEISLSVFNEMIHSCHLGETPVHEADYANSGSVTGPILLGNNGQTTFLCAYEHDSMYPNHFLGYQLTPDKKVHLKAVKGNYFDGQPVDGYSTVWFELAGVTGNEEQMAGQFRRFILKYQTVNLSSRKPYIYYNSWGRQERVKWAGGQYLTTMNLDYTLKEIDRAYQMGIEYYVLDAGWFDRAGDWGVNLKNFPDGFKQIREKLEGYGMKLGVWMDPAKAAVTSKVFQENKSSIKSWNGKPDTPSLVWETEESVDICLVSPYWEYYADVLISLYKELEISYFYLDGVGQSGCDDPGHFHGTGQNTREERQQSYGFLLPVYLGKIMEKVAAACPNVVFDFDVTEDRRIGVGLQFLANGRFFILNNGPYYHNFDLCPRGESILPNGCRNIFIQPGPARTWFMRSVLDYDKWIPSNLFLANYQPDDPENSQVINLASLVLGQNAVWGEILKTSTEGVALFHDILGKYKQVREDVAAASPVHTGSPGDTPEIYEKINPETGKGVVVIFSNSKGKFSYITQNVVVEDFWHNKGVAVKLSDAGYAKIDAVFDEASAAIIFFGVKE
jgi:alpha-galactosidase